MPQRWAGGGINLAERAAQIHSALPEETQNYMTTAVLRAMDQGGTEQIIAATSENTFRTSWVGALNEGEIGVAGPFHAEMNAVGAARALGSEPLEVAASRPICAGCQLGLNAEAVNVSAALKSYPGVGWFADEVMGEGG